MEGLTPMMRQYMETKEEYKDCILLYRLGDFYEMFFDDAVTASKELEITLTGKDCGLEERAPMCGVPHHAVQNYIAKLVGNGHKVAICEQMEDPATAKGIVKRDVVRVITPGTVIESNILEERKNNYVAAIFKVGTYYGIAYSDVSTGEFCTTQITEGNNFAKTLNELVRFAPAEIVVNPEMLGSSTEIKEITDKLKTYITTTDEELLDFAVSGYEKLKDYPYAKEASKLLFAYIKSTQKIDMKHISNVEYYNTSKFMVLDSVARRNLELTEILRDRSKKGSLLWVLDKTETSMGGRLLRRWIEKPLMEVSEINHRLDGVSELKASAMRRGELTELLKHVYDIERLTGKVAYGTVNAKDMVALKNSLLQLPALKKELASFTSPILKELYESLDTLEDIANLIEAAIVDEPPVSVKEGGIIKASYNEEVMKLRKASTEGKSWIVELEAKERELTGIKNLKVGYNKVFGYYIEISKSNVGLAPDRYTRKQTLTTGERFITSELKEIEGTILGAQDRVINLEYEIFVQVRDAISLEIKRLQQSSNAVAIVDVLCSLAEVAEKYNYTKPEMTDSDEIIINEGRHPVVERLIPSGEFVPNETVLNQTTDRVNIITGPNMAGKSTYMRQVALITLMAQIGSFVPADYAKIGIVDRIFTRVGASDDLASGQSTFMVEMNEVANIISNATKKSLLILDEIGRGTSTFDGLSIAWAVVEHIADSKKIGARTLFATHYHELTELENKIEGVKNYCIAVKEKGEDVIFLRKIVRGGADESYGVHVAKLAGIPLNVTSRANEILKTLKENNFVNTKPQEPKKAYAMQNQFDLFNYKLGEIASEIDKINVNELTPIEALNTLVKLKSKL